MAKALKTTTAPLAVLNLAWNGVGETGGSAVAEALKTAPVPLAVLNLAANNLSNGGCIAVAEALKTTPAPLAVLDLCCNGMREAGGIAVAKALKTAPASLAVINIDTKNLGEAGSRLFAEAFVARRCESAAFSIFFLRQFTPHLRRKLGTHSEHPAVLRVVEFVETRHVCRLGSRALKGLKQWAHALRGLI